MLPLILYHGNKNSSNLSSRWLESWGTRRLAMLRIFARYTFLLCLLSNNLALAANEVTIAPQPQLQISLPTTPVIILDAKNVNQIPANFRTTSTPLPATGQVDTTGLFQLRSIGSAQFSQLELKKVVALLDTPIIIIDLRQESHGYVDGDAISWFTDYNWANLGKTDQDVEQVQKDLLSAIKTQPEIVVAKITEKYNGRIDQAIPLKLVPKTVMSEEEFAHSLNFDYQRFYVTDRQAPSDAEVTRFVEFVKRLPKERWVYFHCREGRGRTTTFMAMFDMMRNAKTVTLENIIKRQQVLGGIDLFKLPHENDFRYKYAIERMNLLKRFYQYAATNKDNYQTVWSDWVKLQTIPSKQETTQKEVSKPL